MKRLLLLLLLPYIADADERILDFHSDIVIFTDATIEVTETIRVRAEGRQIRRGIYREIPTEYFDKQGNRHVVRIEPLSVLRDGEPDGWHVKQPRDSITTYFGRSDVILSPGVYEYTFRYRAYRMLGFFDEHDELYWNVSGFDWQFPIDAASASVRFDFDAPENQLIIDAYTGRYGETGRDYSVQRDPGPIVRFRSNSPLSPANGLTIVVAWPKGLVNEPGGVTRVYWFLRDNINTLLALSGLLVLLAYYIPVWRRFGRDPDAGVVVTRYEPPSGYSPASLRYIDRMYYDNKVLTAAIVNLAVKGYLDIVQHDDERSLKRREPPANAKDLAAGEKELLAALFSDGATVELKQENHKILGAARKVHAESLAADYKGKYFKTNALMNLPGALIAIVFTVVSLGAGPAPTPLAIGTIVLMYLVLVFFAIIMKTPTPRGQKLIDSLLGFKDYLEVAEKDELNLRNPPSKTPELFETYLPFALALGVDQAWSEKFSSVLAAVREQRGEDWHPTWYHGNIGATGLSSDLSGTFASAVSRSVSPPGSSSGSGGGGSSGGGGGGGGGGGW